MATFPTYLDQNPVLDPRAATSSTGPPGQDSPPRSYWRQFSTPGHGDPVLCLHFMLSFLPMIFGAEAYRRGFKRMNINRWAKLAVFASSWPSPS